mmetsp:Transcript_9147/g.10450  ORF Transcript_9147/g.10450 Transcript_9147/m.10450 type:complete len:179 (+) Transcript_9147:159-695(+)
MNRDIEILSEQGIVTRLSSSLLKKSKGYPDSPVSYQKKMQAAREFEKQQIAENKLKQFSNQGMIVNRNSGLNSTASANESESAVSLEGNGGTDSDDLDSSYVFCEKEDFEEPDIEKRSSLSQVATTVSCERNDLRKKGSRRFGVLQRLRKLFYEIKAFPALLLVLFLCWKIRNRILLR